MTIKKQKTVLEALLAAPTEAPTTDVFIQRIGTSFKLKALNMDEFNSIATKVESESDLSAAFVAEALESQPFHDAKLMEQYDAMSPIDCVKKVLMAGELTMLADAVTKISGFVGGDA